MDTSLYLGLGFGFLLGAWVVASLWFTDVMYGKSLAARRAREAYTIAPYRG
jgi:hypothetical protein